MISLIKVMVVGGRKNADWLAVRKRKMVLPWKQRCCKEIISFAKNMIYIV